MAPVRGTQQGVALRATCGAWRDHLSATRACHGGRARCGPWFRQLAASDNEAFSYRGNRFTPAIIQYRVWLRGTQPRRAVVGVASQHLTAQGQTVRGQLARLACRQAGRLTRLTTVTTVSRFSCTLGSRAVCPCLTLLSASASARQAIFRLGILILKLCVWVSKCTRPASSREAPMKCASAS